MIKKDLIKKFLKKQAPTEEDFLQELFKPIFTIENIKEKFNKDFNLNKKNENDETYLHLCAKKGNLDSANWLLENGLDLEAQTKAGETALFYAALSNKTPITRFFIAQGANTEHLNEFKRTALQEVVIADKKTIKTLFEHTKNLNNADIHGNNIVFDAIANGNSELIREVIHHKDININHINNEGNTILHKEVVIKNNALSMRLMEAGADPTILDKKGKNFLFYTVLKGIENADIIDKAIDLGCNINTKDGDKKTILMYCLENYLNSQDKQMKESHLEMFKKLLEKGAKLNEVDSKNENVLFAAIRSLDETLIEIILEQNSIEINHENINGETVLTHCCLNGVKASKYIKRLLKSGANANIKDKKGSTVIEKLVEATLYFYNRKKIDDSLLERIEDSANYMDILRLLIENTKVDLSQLNSKGQPLFFDPVVYFNNELFKLFKHYEVNINLKDKNGHNIIFYLMNYAEHTPNYDQKLYLETLQNMINIGVEIDTKDLNGESILHKAVNDKCEYTIKLLLNSKPDIYIRDNKGRTLIHNSVWKDDLRYFKIIHSYDESLMNHSDKFGVLPINYAAFMGKYDLVKVMLEAGAHVNNTSDISPKMLDFFNKFHENIKNLEKQADNKIEEQNLKLLSNSMKKEFKID